MNNTTADLPGRRMAARHTAHIGVGGDLLDPRPEMVDVLIPAAANLKVKTGSRVKGGSTVLAVLPELPVETESAAMAVVA